MLGLCVPRAPESTFLDPLLENVQLCALQSRAVCDNFVMTRQGVPFYVRANNPYGAQIPLIDAIVCSFGFNDRTGIVTVGGNIGCGGAGKPDVVNRFGWPMIDKPNYVVYQTQNPAREYQNAYGEFVINADVQTCDVVFVFDNSQTLNEVVFLAPYLLYNTLAENLQGVDLGAYDPVVLAQAEQVRDDILQRLKDAFAAEGISVQIDEETGKITLDNSILFAFNSYELSPEGKAYLDRFLRAYANALLDGEHSEAIKAVQFDGHTDTVGSHEYNQKLSEQRAESVRQYCVGLNNAGLTNEQAFIFNRIAVAVGHSFDEPIYNPDGSVNMDASRRVEIKFFLNIDD